jgi:thiol-disulfide isomerase/thioredoxin
MRFAVLAFVAACGGEQRPRVELLEAPASKDVAQLVSAQLQAAARDHKQLVVYVGATWCEPCRRFHEAAAAGQLDDSFGQLRLLEFDADRDGDALEKAGYGSQMIPLFALPKADGTSSGKQIEGSIKGDGAVANITPRLRSLLDGP